MCSVYTIASNIEGGVLWKKFSETFKQNPWEIYEKKFSFSKVAGAKNEFMHAYFSRFLLKI